MSDEAGLLLAIREHPADDLPRMAWADWLDDYGRPERAELVRLQLALARGDESGREREQELLAKHGQRWLDEDLPGFGLAMSEAFLPYQDESTVSDHAAFRRGFPGVLFMPMQTLLVQGRKLAARVPTIARVQLLDLEPLEYEDSWEWLWANRGHDAPHALPDDLIKRLVMEDGSHWLENPYPSRDAALQALSQACISFSTGVMAEPLRRHGNTPGQVAGIIGISRKKGLEVARHWQAEGKSHPRQPGVLQLPRRPCAVHAWQGHAGRCRGAGLGR